MFLRSACRILFLDSADERSLNLCFRTNQPSVNEGTLFCSLVAPKELTLLLAPAAGEVWR